MNIGHAKGGAADGVVDLIIIGGGPVGLFGAFYAGMRSMSLAIVDSLPELGGQLMALYPEKFVYDVPGFLRVMAKELAARLIEQAGQYPHGVHLGVQVTGLEFDEGSRVYTLKMAEGALRGRTLLLSTGIGAFSAKRLPVPEAGRFEGRGLSYTIKGAEGFRGKRVLVVGGGDSALDWANTLVEAGAAGVTLVHRSDRFRAHEESVARLRAAEAAGRARVVTFHEVKALVGGGDVEGAVVYDNRSKREEMLSVEHVVASLGFETTLGAIAEFGLELKGNKVVVDARMRTSRPGVFAAGDVASHEGKLALIATGFGEAAIAVNFAKNYIDPKSAVFPGHSSSMR